MIQCTAAEYGITYADFMEEAEAFFAMSLDAQLAEVDRITAELQAHGMTMDNIDDIKATLIREYRP
jgi:hypothetical protein